MFTLDHLAVAGETLANAVEHVETSLGVSMQPGGQHPRFGTHNRLLGLEDGLYLEAIAVEPGAPATDSPRWFDLDRFSGPARLSNWIVRGADLNAQAEDLVPHARRSVEMQRGDLRWKMTVPADGILPFDNLYPAALQWQSPPPAGGLSASGCRLIRLVLAHPDAEKLNETLERVVRDDRVVIEPGEVGFLAEFDTPHGRRVLR